MGRRIGILITALTTFGLALPNAAGADLDELCQRFGEGEETGRVDSPALDEISGLVASRRHPGVLWTHNDSGAPPELFALSEEGRLLGVYDVEGADNIDWEDIAIGPAPLGGDEMFLYLGDIGDNASRRERVTVYRLPEPVEPPAGQRQVLGGVEIIHLQYPEGPEDAESLIVDPLGGDLYIITKNYLDPRDSRILRAPAESLVDGAEVTMDEMGQLESAANPEPIDEVVRYGHFVTGADVSPDGRIVLVRTYQDVLAFPREEGSALHEAFEAQPCSAPSEFEPQGEAIAFSLGGDAYFTVSEGLFQPMYRFAVDPPAAQRSDARGESSDSRPPSQVAPAARAGDLPATGDPPTASVGLLLLAAATIVAAGGRRRTTRPPGLRQHGRRPST